ncbi:MAG: hypothetical protein DRG59_05575 [Deltaproteobacteria bacterium]|nr:MAG: hypothetical protein DRG83_01110 [Deltaproteobacteria bacterium]RLB08097.1 MAG: hypothetical protein DRG59_05575 [Deltaproteobacteria bacterium]
MIASNVSPNVWRIVLKMSTRFICQFVCLLLFTCIASSAFALPEKDYTKYLKPSQKYLDTRLKRILQLVSLKYYRGMSKRAREADWKKKIERAYDLVGIDHLYELRKSASEKIEAHRIPWSWEYYRRLKSSDGYREGVRLAIPVWIPRYSRTVKLYGGFKKKWEEITKQDRYLGYVYFCPSLKNVNDKRHYRPSKIYIEVSREFAPFAYMFFQYIFREGLASADLRVPIMSVRCGEDTFAAIEKEPPPPFTCAEFRDEINGDFHYRVITKKCESFAEIIHGHHKGKSNHRIGCAFDINSFDFPEVKDGSPNPISRARRQFARDRLHKIDARNIPQWVYDAAEDIGFRVPYQWSYGWGFTDWHHFDCGKEPKMVSEKK